MVLYLCPMKDADIIFAFLVSLGADELSMSQLMALAAPFRITETNVRSCLSRLHARDVIQVRKEGRAAWYRLGGRGKRVGSNVARHFRDPDWSGWNGSYWAAAFSLSDSRERYRIRKKLLAYRFRALYPGLWIRPLHPDEDLPGVFGDSIRAGGFDLFSGGFVREISRQRISVLYDLETTAAALSRALMTARRSIESAASLSSEAAFVERMVTGASLVPALASDPLLPPALLPEGWPAAELRRVFGEWNAVYSELIAPFVGRALGR
jgi:phenylacetic acid degradation operon negative regulatory protein